MAYNPFRNPGMKALSLLFATLLWLTVSRDSQVERSLQVPLEFQNMPASLEIVGETPSTATVRLRGASSQLGSLALGSVVAVVDLQAARPGSRLFHLVTSQVRAPYGVDVVEVSPATISLLFESAGKKTVKVVPMLIGRPRPGYVAGAITVDPADVDVVGPVSRLNDLTEATTEPVSVENATGVIADRVTVGVTDSELRLSQPVTARVTVQVVPAPVERTLEAVPVQFENLKPGLRANARPPSVGVVLRGEPEGLAALRAGDVLVVVDMAGLGRGTHRREVKAGGSPRFDVVGIVPSSVEVRVR